MSEIGACRRCGASFEARPGKLFCGRPCANRWHAAKHAAEAGAANRERVRPCKHCGARFTPMVTGGLAYCSTACRIAHRPACRPERRRVSPAPGCGEGLLLVTPPTCVIGQVMQCRRYGDATVTGLTPLGWPLCRPAGKPGRAYVWCPELVGLIRHASASEAARALGLDITTVSRWRKRLGVPRMTEGTARIWRAAAGKLRATKE